MNDQKQPQRVGKVSLQQLTTFADRVQRKPDRPVHPREKRALNLSDDDIDSMRNGTWEAPESDPTPFDKAVSAAVTVTLAPIQAAAEAARDALVGILDNPHPAAVTPAVEAVAKVALAIADTAPAPATTEPTTPSPPTRVTQERTR